MAPKQIIITFLLDNRKKIKYNHINLNTKKGKLFYETNCAS